ncbi:MAG: hypothetical protein J6R80_05000 [Kiritimatiellae bacterium]|nr:hypothetical protein [Kiritimatiellia bacterium]
MPKMYPNSISSINARLLPLVLQDLIDVTIEKGHEKPKQQSIKNSKIPITPSFLKSD